MAGFKTKKRGVDDSTGVRQPDLYAEYTSRCVITYAQLEFVGGVKEWGHYLIQIFRKGLQKNKMQSALCATNSGERPYAGRFIRFQPTRSGNIQTIRRTPMY